ncbi:unnamed protein product [Calypogeia fissa]
MAAVAAGVTSLLASSASVVQQQASVQSVPGSISRRTLVAQIPQFHENSIVATKLLRPSTTRRHVLRKSAAFRPVVVAVGDEKKSWDMGKFIQTWQFFNEPFDLGKFVGNIIAKVSGSGSEERPSVSRKEVVLVAGATGGVGKRVVNVLVDRGIPVRALVRNLNKARSLLGPAIDVVTGDITQKSTLLPEYFKDVRAVVNCVAVTVGPKEGDTADRQKYFQGIKFFDPEIKGDSPETVEFKGIENLIEAVKGSTGVREGVTLYTIGARGPVGPAWGSLDDNVMGGVSESSLQISSTGGEDGGPVGVFKGNISLANNGGFASVRTKNFNPPQDLSPYDGLELRVKGNGNRFKLIIRTTSDWDGIAYTGFFDTTNDWQTICIPFSEFVPLFRARSLQDAVPLDTSSINSLQLLYSKFEYDGKLNPAFEPGPFELPIATIKSYLKKPITPRFIHIGSAGVTRPDRPGLDLSKQPPAVRMNKELGYILTYKLKGEDAIRDSGIPYTIIRPVALTEEPAGADLIFEQGDNITGKIAREEVARIVVAALKSPPAVDTTFEVKSTVPFSEPFTVDPNNPPAERDYATEFESLNTGVTGKEALEAVSV